MPTSPTVNRKRLTVSVLCAVAAVLITAALGLGAAARWLPRLPLLDQVPFSAAVTDRSGTLLRLSRAEDGIFRLHTPLSAVSPELISTTLFYEDRHFRSHPGVNPFSVLRAAAATLTGSRPIGASTITMQVARLRFGLQTRTIAGKLQQMFWALRLEAHYSKDEILEAYFNLAPYGGNIEGVGAVARIYFHKSAIDLNRSEALALAVMPQNPRERRSQTKAFLEAFTRLSAALPQSHQGSLERFLAAVPPTMHRVEDLPFRAPHYVEQVQKRFPHQLVRGTLSWPLQQRMQELLTTSIARYRPWGIANAALLVADRRSGEVLSYLGSADFFNEAIDGQVDGLQAPRSPGSTLKTFLYALALDQGLIHPQTILIDRPQTFGAYSPENADGHFRGPLSAAQALVASRNIPAIALEAQLNPDLYAFLQSANIPLPFDRAHYGLSIVLGGAEVRAFDLARLYTMLGRSGIDYPLSLTLEPQEKVAVPARSLLSPEACWIVERMLAERGETITVRGRPVELLYKTGTSNGFRDAWAAGSVGDYVIVVWAGNFSGAPNANLQGALLAAPLFREAARRLYATPGIEPPAPIDPNVAPSGLHVSLESACRATGDIGVPQCTDRVPTWFIPGVSPVRDSGILREILIDPTTGLRSCRPRPGNQKVLWEFWPSDFQAVFRRAGIIKRPPPPWEEGCNQEQSAVPGNAPQIVAPTAGTVFYEGTGKTGGAAMALRASTDPDVQTLYWFAGKRFLGAAAAADTLVAELTTGSWPLTVVDDHGRSSSLTVLVRRP